MPTENRSSNTEMVSVPREQLRHEITVSLAVARKLRQFSATQSLRLSKKQVLLGCDHE